MSEALFPAMCFGKLPSHGDFVRYNAASREVLAFDDWIHQGLYFSRMQCGTSWDQTFAAAPRYHFLFYPENADRFLVGLMQSSHDKSMRRYPFLVSLLIDRRRFIDGQAYLLPVTLSEFFDRGRQLLERALNGMETRDIADQTQSMSVAVLDSVGPASAYHDEFLSTMTQERFWKNLFGSSHDPRKYLLFKNLGEALQPFRNRSLHRLTLGLRFPLSVDARTTSFEVCFWVQVCLTMLGASTVIPILFWDAPQQRIPGRLFLFFRQPSARNYLQLLRPDIESETICVVDEEGKDKLATLPHAPSNGLNALLDSEEEMLGQFLQRLKKVSDAGMSDNSLTVK